MRLRPAAACTLDHLFQPTRRAVLLALPGKRLSFQPSALLRPSSSSLQQHSKLPM